MGSTYGGKEGSVYIDPEKCTGCEICIPCCPVAAISSTGGVVAIDFDGCVECAVCQRYGECPTDAIRESPETSQWPRRIRREFSDTMATHSTTGRRGRGSGGVKVNDVSGRIGAGEVGLTLEFGRPVLGTRLAEVEKMTAALAKIGVRFESENPVSALLADPATGQMLPEVRGERVLTATLRVDTTLDKLPQIAPVVREVSTRVNTVISWGITVRYVERGSVPALERLREMGITPRPNGKINLGMGRPLVGH